MQERVYSFKDRGQGGQHAAAAAAGCHRKHRSREGRTDIRSGWHLACKHPQSESHSRSSSGSCYTTTSVSIVPTASEQVVISPIMIMLTFADVGYSIENNKKNINIKKCLLRRMSRMPNAYHIAKNNRRIENQRHYLQSVDCIHLWKPMETSSNYPQK